MTQTSSSAGPTAATKDASGVSAGNRPAPEEDAHEPDEARCRLGAVRGERRMRGHHRPGLSDLDAGVGSQANPGTVVPAGTVMVLSSW